jgi:dTDP-4-amino-4,6-dideoxygalactose transaminase
MIPFLDLNAQHKAIKPEIDEAVIEVLESGQFMPGRAVEAFERSFADYNVRYAIACSSGTAALQLALAAAGIGRGDDAPRRADATWHWLWAALFDAVHLHPCFAELGRRRGDFPVSERESDCELLLPLRPEMTRAMVDEVNRVLALAAARPRSVRGGSDHS